MPQISTYLTCDTAAMPNIPGTGNLLTLPLDIISSIQSIKGAIACKDKQSLFDATIRTVGLPFNAVNSIGQNIEVGIQSGLLPNDRFNAFAKITVIFGIILCLIELVIEGLHIFRQRKFLKKLNAQPSLEQKMRWISKKYLEVDESKKQAKLIKLSRLIRPFAADQVRKELPILFKRYYDKKSFWGHFDGDKWATKVVSLIETQSEKRITFHTLGILTLIITLIGLTLSVTSCNPWIGNAFTITGLVMGLNRYALHKGYYDQEGWTFHWNKLIPNWIPRALMILRSQNSLDNS